MEVKWFRKYLVPIVIFVVLIGLIIFVDVFRSEGWAKPVFDLLNRQALVLSAAAGVHAKIVSEALGHSTVAITLDIYSHVTPGLQEAAAKQLDSLLPVGVARTA